MENKQKLICVIMGQNCERFIEMCLESVKEADVIVYCDGGSTDNTLDIVNEELKGNNSNSIIENKYNQEDKQMNGIQRNFYLQYLKKNYPNDWVICLDADEVVEDLNKIKEFIQTAEPCVYAIKMRHLIQDLAHEDATTDRHFVPQRLFKISEADYYPLVEHPVLQSKFKESLPIKNEKNLITIKHIEKDNLLAYIGITECTTIWHLAYIPNLWEIKKRYDNHLKKSEMHTPEYLNNWYRQHLFGKYPKKEFNPVELPEVILNHFGINKDELYFQNRQIEFKHILMVQQWNEHFKPDSVLDLGAGRGCYLYFWKWFVEKCYGIEISLWAINMAFTSDIIQGDISNIDYPKSDLITAVDVLEHLTDDELDKTLKNIVKYGNKFIFSIPFAPNDQNLYLDNTHKQFKTKDEWKELIKSYGINVADAPTNWHFHQQILIGIK